MNGSMGGLNAAVITEMILGVYHSELVQAGLNAELKLVPDSPEMPAIIINVVQQVSLPDWVGVREDDGNLLAGEVRTSVPAGERPADAG